MITLHLKKKWFDLIKSGEKKEEYRKLTDYYIKRLAPGYSVLYGPPGFVFFNKKTLEMKKVLLIENVKLVLGYPKKGDATKEIIFKKALLYIGMGKEEFGAAPNEYYLIIRNQEG